MNLQKSGVGGVNDKEKGRDKFMTKCLEGYPKGVELMQI